MTEISTLLITLFYIGAKTLSGPSRSPSSRPQQYLSDTSSCVGGVRVLRSMDVCEDEEEGGRKEGGC